MNQRWKLILAGVITVIIGTYVPPLAIPASQILKEYVTGPDLSAR